MFSHKGLPLWLSHAKRLATKAQMSALRALYGACAGCGADMWVCQGHHIRPVSQGGPTNIDNMMLLCWACHQKVHHHRWRVVPDGRGLYTIAPPERIRYGPAHAPDPLPAHGPPPRNTARHPGAGSIARAAPDRAAPDRAAPDRAAPDRAAPAPDRAAPDRAAPDRAAPDRAAPDRAAPDRAAPDRAAPDRAAPDRAAPDRAAPDRAAPDRAAPDRADPADGPSARAHQREPLFTLA